MDRLITGKKCKTFTIYQYHKKCIFRLALIKKISKKRIKGFRKNCFQNKEHCKIIVIIILLFKIEIAFQ